jgi:hypothetical protein
MTRVSTENCTAGAASLLKNGNCPVEKAALQTAVRWLIEFWTKLGEGMWVLKQEERKNWSALADDFRAFLLNGGVPEPIFQQFTL